MGDEVIEGVGVPVAAAAADAVMNGDGAAGGGIDGGVPGTATPEDKIEALRRVGVFADLPEDQLRWFAENAVERRLEAGDVLFRKGDPAEYMAVYLEGEVHAYRDEMTHDGYVYIARAGDPATEVSGVLPFSRMTELAATGRVVTRMRALLFHTSLFPELLQRMPLLAQRLVGIMSDRVRETTKADQDRDKLISLGKLSAGLAHELNNPAAAAARAATDLLATLEELRAVDLRLCRHDVSSEQRAIIAQFEGAAIERHNTAAPLGALEQSDREDEVSAWLDARGVADGWKLASTFVEAMVDAAELEKLAAEIKPDLLGDVLARVGAQLSAARLTSDVRVSTARISELVAAIKEYTYMDQAAVQEVDVHKGLENTLLILKYKLRRKNITVARDYAGDAPRVKAYGSQLNQVWTNLIVNAIEAMSEGGTLTVRTRREPTDLLVEIGDDGPGIPEELRTRVFEPFFTTKPVGEGTGLGLDTVARIVRKHRGNIRVESKPGDTKFQIRLLLKETSGDGDDTNRGDAERA